MNRAIFLILWTIFFAAISLKSPIAADAENRQPNRLLGAQSPYLQQHIYNTVDWFPWGEEALEKARREQKPIFISVGYSTCHWCHVMSRESFDDEAIGKFLNENFVSIKIDRERRPDLDEQFMLATQALTGRGGWPNSVFLTDDGKPFYAATYLPPGPFLNVLQQISKLWADERGALQAEGEQISAAIIGYMNRTEAARDVSPEAVKQILAGMMEQVDYFSGGLGTAPKFPQESAMMLLLDQAKRGDQQALGVVIGALDGMIKGGIHDHVGGGFHRYAVDPQWVVPHFEKMLYNQALIGRLLVDTYALTGFYRYKHAAIRTFDYVLREMQADAGGYFSAQDADSYSESGEKGEGHFYIWSKKELEEIDAAEVAAIREIYNISEDGNFEGKNILTLESRIDEIAGERETDEESLYANIDAGLDRLRLIRESTRRAPHKDEKIVVSWNAMMIETLARASRILERPDYWQSAKKSADYIVGSMLFPDGLKRVSYESQIGVDGQLGDYAGLALALMSVEDFTPIGEEKHDYSDTVNRLAKDIEHKFGDPQVSLDRPFRMTTSGEGIGEFLPLEDNPIPSGNSLALRLFRDLAEHRGQLPYKKKARLLSSTLSGYALASPEIRGTLVNTAYDLNHGSADNLRFVASGNAFVELKTDRENRKINLMISLNDKWHINSNTPLESYFVPTVLSLDGVKAPVTIYPEPKEKKLGFNEKALSLYENQLELELPLPSDIVNRPRKVNLQLQACSDEICLEPEDLVFHFWDSGTTETE